MSSRANWLRVTAIVLLALTAVVTVVSGIGIYCAAFDTLNYPSLSALMPFQWLYQLYMVATLIGGLAGLWATVGLLRRSSGSLRFAYVVLLGIVATALAQVVTSQILRGKSMPNDIRLALAVVTLLVFWIGRRALAQASASGPATGARAGTAAGAALVVSGLALAVAPVWTHVEHGASSGNWASVADIYIVIMSIVACVAGIAVLVESRAQAGKLARREIQSSNLRSRA